MNEIPHASGSRRPALDPDHPYLGLQPFAECDTEYFFGRDREKHELFRRVQRDVLTVVFGASGLGKTSLLSAGLFPLLRAASLLPIPVRLSFAPTADDLILQLKTRTAEEVGTWCVDTPVPESEETLWEYFHRAHFWHKANNRLLTPVLVFDQFEEIFTLGQKDDRVGESLQALADVIENQMPLSVRVRLDHTNEELPYSYDKPKAKVIISLREDYIAQLEDLRSLIHSLGENRFRLMPLNGEQGLAAVVRPAAHLVSKDVGERIVRFVAGGDGDEPLTDLEIEPSLLSLVCDQLNRKRLEDGLPVITEDLLELARESLLRDFYDRSVSDCAPAIRVLIEEELLTASGLRSSKALEDVLAAPGVTRQDIDGMVNRRLLRVEEHLNVPHVELIHDVLTDAIRESRQGRREHEARERQRAAERRQTRWVIGSALAGLVFLAAAVVAVAKWREADQAFRSVEAHRLAAESARVLAGPRPEKTLSLLLATESLKRTRTVLGQVVWADAMQAMKFDSREMSTVGSVTAATISADGARIAFVSIADTVRVSIWDVESGEEIATLPYDYDGIVTAVTFSRDGSLIATGGAGDAVLVWDARSFEPLPRLVHEEAVIAFGVSADGTRVVTASLEPAVHVWDVATAKLLKRQPHAVPVRALALAADGSTLAAAGVDNRVRIWGSLSGEGPPSQLVELADQLEALAFSSDGNQLATADARGVVQLWDTKSGRESTRLSFKSVRAMAFRADGRRLWVVVGEDRGRYAVRAWPWRIADMAEEACSFLSRNLQDYEWRKYFKEEAYRRTCENLPLPSGH